MAEARLQDNYYLYVDLSHAAITQHAHLRHDPQGPHQCVLRADPHLRPAGSLRDDADTSRLIVECDTA